MTVLITLALLLFPAHAGKRRAPPDFIEDILAYATVDRDKALVLVDAALEDERQMSAHGSTVHLYAAEQYRLAGNENLAHTHFLKVVESVDQGPDLSAAHLGLAILDAGTRPNSNTVNVLQDIPEKEALDTQNADRYLLLAEHAWRTGQQRGAVYARKALLFAKEDPTVEKRVIARLDLLATPPAPGADGPHAESPDPVDPLTRAEDALRSGDKETARALATVVRDEGGTDARTAGYLLRRIDAGPVQTDKIAVLLPMTGRYEPAARQVREALEFGFDGSMSTLVYYDTEADPEKAVAELERAVFEDGVVAAVGPLLTDETEPLYQAAQAMRVPLLSLSQALDPEQPQDWVYQTMVTAGVQVAHLLDYAMTHKEMQNFAIFAPDSAYGHRAADAFRSGVEARGGTIRVATFYDVNATDLLPFAKELGRKDYENRAWEFTQLKKEAEERNLDVNKVVLPPVIDFDAIFIPDNARRVPVACAALAYEEFPMGDFQPKKDDETVIPLLGLSGWNNPSLVGQGGPYARGSYFVDSFLPPYVLDEERDPAWKPDPETHAFTTAYKMRYNRTPTPLEAVAVDAGRLLAAAVTAMENTEDAQGRDGFREALNRAEPTEMITGASGFQEETRRPDWQLKILTIRKDGIFPVQLPAAPPDQPLAE